MSLSLPCEVIYGRERGEALHRFVEDQLQAACPCFTGKPCPIIDKDGGSPLIPVSAPAPDPSPTRGLFIYR